MNQEQIKSKMGRLEQRLDEISQEKIEKERKKIENEINRLEISLQDLEIKELEKEDQHDQFGEDPKHEFLYQESLQSDRLTRSLTAFKFLKLGVSFNYKYISCIFYEGKIYVRNNLEDISWERTTRKEVLLMTREAE